MKHPPTAVLFLLSCVISMSPRSRFTIVMASWVGQPQSSYDHRIKLFKHVLLNDEEWSPVLKQKVKLSSLSLPKYRRTDYNGEVLDQIELVPKEDEQNPTALKVLQTLMDQSPWCGTNVNYAAYVLSTAFMCFTYTNVSFLLSLVVDRIGVLASQTWVVINKDDTKKEMVESSDKISQDEDDEKIEYTVDDVLDIVRVTLKILVDKVAAVDGELAFFSRALHDIDEVDKTKNHSVIFDTFKAMKKNVDARLERHCHLTHSKDVYHYLSKHEVLNVSPTPVDELTADEDTLKHEIEELNKIIDSMIDVYDGFNAETFHMKTWIIILDYSFPISIDIKFYVDDLKEESTGQLDYAVIRERESKKLEEELTNIRRRRRRRMRRREYLNDSIESQGD